MSPSSVLAPVLRDLSDSLDDLSNAALQNFNNVFGRFLSIIDSEPMASFIDSAIPKVDFDSWWAIMRDKTGAVVGSGVLDWPTDRAERVGMQLQLCRALQSDKLNILEFTLNYCPGTRNIGAPFVRFVQIIMLPLLRDISRLAENRILPPMVLEVMGNLPRSGDDKLDNLLQEAIIVFRDPSPTTRQKAVERLWDVWERLKSLDEDNKKQGVMRLIESVSDDKHFCAMLEAEARALTDIGNDFHIRHFEQNRTEIERPEHYDYLFYRLYALIHLLLLGRAASRGTHNTMRN